MTNPSSSPIMRPLAFSDYRRAFIFINFISMISFASSSALQDHRVPFYRNFCKDCSVCGYRQRLEVNSLNYF